MDASTKTTRRAFCACILAALSPVAARAQNFGDGRPTFLPIDRIVVSVFRGDVVDRHEMLLMSLELSGTEAITRVQVAMPRLQDAFTRIWNRVGTAPGAADRGIDVAAGRAAMIAACDRIVGQGTVVGVMMLAQSSRKVKPPAGRG
ncbi:MAG: hypothetical protein ACKOGH_16810 [Alphaproteobacteria bacterium]